MQFENCQAVPFGGVLLLIPFLERQGFFSYKQHYTQLSGYYHLDQIFLLCAMMYLCRLSNPEQLKTIAPGEYGKLMGLDRVPETNCLRRKLHQVNRQNRGQQWSAYLSNQWIEEESPHFFYIDGHTQIYYGHKANLGKKYIARQKLCMPGVSDYYVNDGNGLPYFYIRGELNEKLLEMLKHHIIPQLLSQTPSRTEELTAQPDMARFTIVMDRESWQPGWFIELWQQHRIAVLTYKKYANDNWSATDFKPMQVTLRNGEQATMYLAEKDTVIQGYTFREIRKLSDNKHQTSILTTNKLISIDEVACHMFARWSQENFFRYMRQNYALDQLFSYQVEQLDNNLKVINPVYAALSHKIKKIKEKMNRSIAELSNSVSQNAAQPLETTPIHQFKQFKLKERISNYQAEIDSLKAERKQHQRQITIKEMPESTRYNKLEHESKLVQNIIKMICYRAETAFANQLAPHYKQSAKEIRELAKTIIKLPCDITVNNENKILNITLYSLANPRANLALSKAIELINQTQTQYPGTNLTIVFDQNATS